MIPTFKSKKIKISVSICCSPWVFLPVLSTFRVFFSASRSRVPDESHNLLVLLFPTLFKMILPTTFFLWLKSNNIVIRLLRTIQTFHPNETNFFSPLLYQSDRNWTKFRCIKWLPWEPGETTSSVSKGKHPGLSFGAGISSHSFISLLYCDSRALYWIASHSLTLETSRFSMYPHVKFLFSKKKGKMQ